jgi:hypothetical protein
MGPATHLARQQLQTSDVPFDRALTPGQRHRCLDGGHVRPESSGQAPDGRESARGGARQPGFKLARLTLTDQGSNVLCDREPLQSWRLPGGGRLTARTVRPPRLIGASDTPSCQVGGVVAPAPRSPPLYRDGPVFRMARWPSGAVGADAEDRTDLRCPMVEWH